MRPPWDSTGRMVLSALAIGLLLGGLILLGVYLLDKRLFG